MKLLFENELFQVFRTEPNDWKEIKKEIMEIENKVFEKETRQTEDDIKETFTYKKSICLIVKLGNKIVAYTMAAPLEFYPYLYFDDYYEEKDSLYIESTAVLPEYQGKGMSKLLKKY